MNKNWNCVLLIFSCMVFFWGCAMTLTEVNLNYRLPAEIAPTFQSPPTSAIRMGTIWDKRGYENPRLLIHKTNLHGDTTKGGYLAEKPLSMVIADALQEAFMKAKFNMDNEKGAFVVTGELLAFNLDRTHGLKSRITVALSLTKVSSQEMIWSKTFVGRAIVTKPPWIENSFNLAVDDLIKKVIASKSLTSQLKD